MNILSKLLHKVPKCVTGVTILTFCSIIFIGIFDCANPIMASQMSTDETHAGLTDCIPGKNCGMDINTHIEIWQGMITANISTGFFDLLISLLMAAFILIIYKIRPSSLTFSRYSPCRYYERNNRESKLYNHFVHIFSNGILQPKLFSR